MFAAFASPVPLGRSSAVRDARTAGPPRRVRRARAPPHAETRAHPHVNLVQPPQTSPPTTPPTPPPPSTSADALPPPALTPTSSSPPPPPPPPSNDQARALAIALALSATSFGLATYLGHDVPGKFPASLDMPLSTSVYNAVSAFVAGPHFAVSLGMGISAFIQALTGFGFAIVSVAALTQVPWIAHSSVFNAVQPVAATLGALTGWILILPEFKRVDWKAVSVLLAASTMTTPIGAVMLEYFKPEAVIRGLGALISGFVLYSALGVPVPKKLGGVPGAWGLGFLAGALGGAFDITGPPLVVHGEAAGWETSNGNFRRNVLAVVTINSSLVVLWDFFAGRLNDYYYMDFVRWATPTTLVGIVCGKLLADRLDPSAFKKIVLGTCMVMGVKLLFT